MKLRIAVLLLVAVSLACAIEKKTTVVLHSERGDCSPGKTYLKVVVVDGSGDTFWGANMVLTSSCLSSPQLPIPFPNDGFFHDLGSNAKFSLDSSCRDYTLSVTVESAVNPAEPWYRHTPRKLTASLLRCHRDQTQPPSYGWDAIAITQPSAKKCTPNQQCHRTGHGVASHNARCGSSVAAICSICIRLPGPVHAALGDSRMTSPSKSLPPLLPLVGIVFLLATGGVLLLFTNGWGGLEGAYYINIRGPELERAYGFKLGQVPSGSDPVPRYAGFVEVHPNGVLAQSGINVGDLIANHAWIYTGSQQEGLYRALSGLEQGRNAMVYVISPEASVGESPLGWQAKARVITIKANRASK